MKGDDSLGQPEGVNSLLQLYIDMSFVLLINSRLFERLHSLSKDGQLF